MKEYQVLTAQTPEEAEAAMNRMARQGRRTHNDLEVFPWTISPPPWKI